MVCKEGINEYNLKEMGISPNFDTQLPDSQTFDMQVPPENDYNEYFEGLQEKFNPRELTKNDSIYVFVREYFRRVSKRSLCVDSNLNIMSGMPIIKGTRIPLITILQYLLDGENLEALKEDFDITEEDFHSSLNYLLDVLGSPYYE